MTFSRIPANPSDLYALMGAEGLFAHLTAITAALERAGVEITPDARRGLDEIEECVLEHYGRSNPEALRRHIAKAQAEVVVTNLQHGRAN